MDTASTPPPAPTAAPPVPPARTWEMLCHLSALAGFVIPLGNLIGPFLVWQLKKNEFPTVDAHGKQALNFQLSCLIYAAVSFVLIFVLIGIPLLIAVGVFNLICVIVATIKVNNGQTWKYPLALSLFK
jgi:uncharacterized Tic20 family protein